MQKVVLIYLLLALIPCSIVAQTGDWEEFKSYEGRFRALFPGEPSLNVDTVETAVGKLIYHVFYYQEPADSADNLIYMVSYCDYPEGALPVDSVELINDFFEVTIQSSADAVEGELIYSTERNYLAHPGRFWRINYQNGRAVIKTRAFLVGRRYYALQTATFRERSLNPSSDKFIDSIRIIN